MVRVYMIKADVVDKVCGAGVFDTFQTLQDDFIEEQTRAFVNEKRFTGAWAASIQNQLQADLAFAEKVDDDYATYLETVSNGGTTDVVQGENMVGVLGLATSVLMSVNDTLDDMFNLGILGLLTGLEAQRVNMHAKTLEDDLKKLKAALEKAKREVREAYAQAAIDAAITGILLYVGPVGWMTLGAVAIGQMVVDNYLGPNTSDSATWGNRANTTMGAVGSATEKYMVATSKVVRIAKPAGKAIIVVGAIFDVNEVMVGYANVDAIKALIEQTKKDQELLIGKLNLVKSIIANLSIKFDQLRADVEKRTDGWTAKIRATLEDEMNRKGYRPKV